MFKKGSQICRSFLALPNHIGPYDLIESRAPAKGPNQILQQEDHGGLKYLIIKTKHFKPELTCFGAKPELMFQCTLIRLAFDSHRGHRGIYRM